MTTESPIVIIFYIEIGNLDNKDIQGYLQQIREQTKEEHGCVKYIIPTRGQPHSRVECINPKFVGAEEYAKVTEMMGRMQEAIELCSKEHLEPPDSASV